MKHDIAILIGAILISSLASAAEPASPPASKTAKAKSEKSAKPAPARTEIKVPESLREKMKDLSAVLRMVKITPLVNKKDEVVGMQLAEISDQDIVNVLKAKNGDVISDVYIYHKNEDTLEKTTHSARSPGEVMQLYAALVGASRVDVDIQRGKNVVPMSYVLGD